MENQGGLRRCKVMKGHMSSLIPGDVFSVPHFNELLPISNDDVSLRCHIRVLYILQNQHLLLKTSRMQLILKL